MVEFTDNARKALLTSLAAARRFDPDAHLRVVRQGTGVRVVLATGHEPGDQAIDLGGATIGVEPGIEGTVDAGEHNELSMVGP